MKIKSTNFFEWRVNLHHHPKIQRAAMLAALFHAGQYRKYSEEDYIVHPYEVYKELENHLQENTLLSEYTDLEISMLCAALLHDSIEDTPIKDKDIEDVTDKDTLRIIKELTNPSKGVKAPRAVRKQMDRDHLQEVSNEAKTIKLIDRILNLTDIKTCPEKDFVQLYASESRQLLDSLKGTNETLELRLLKLIEDLEK